MSKWIAVVILLLAAHFSASYLVPLDEAVRKTFGGLLAWAWPWAYGNRGPLGTIAQSSGFPIVGFWIAVTSGGLFVLAALALMSIWIPVSWWRVLAVAGAALSLILMGLFLDLTKLLPIAADLVILAAAAGRLPLAIH